MSSRGVVAGLILVAACGTRDVIAVRLLPVDADVPDTGSDAGPTNGCPGPVLLPGSGACSGAFAAGRFEDGICACFGKLYANGGLDVDAFDSRVGAYSPVGANLGGSVASNAPALITSDSTITGDFTTVSGAGLGLGAATLLHVLGTMIVYAPLSGPDDAAVDVDGDLWVAGSLILGTLTVDGTMYHRSSEFRMVDVLATNGPIVDDEMDPVYPCECGVAGTLDIPAIVASAASENENAAIGLGATDLASLGSSRSLLLPCGRYFVSGVHGPSGVTLTVRVRGHVALFVDGAVDAPGLVVTLDPGATLDLFVTGDLAFAPSWQLGDVASPAALRIYTDGTEAIDLGSGIALAGALHAEHVSITSSVPLVHHGSLVFDTLDLTSRVTVHEDLALLAAGADCASP